MFASLVAYFAIRSLCCCTCDSLIALTNYVVLCYSFGSQDYSRAHPKSKYALIEFVKKSILIFVQLLCSVKPFASGGYPNGGSTGLKPPSTAVSSEIQPPSVPPWDGRAIATHKLRLVEFSAFMEHQREPEIVSFLIHQLTYSD